MCDDRDMIDSVDAPVAPGVESQSWRRNVALLVPLLLVNAVAIYGQTLWATDHLRQGVAVAVLFAVAVESIGVYLAYEAHMSRMAGHAAGLLQLGAYAVGTLIGTLNFSHFAGPAMNPNALALTFGLLSAISPWLWAIRSRSMNRARLFALGLIDPRAVKFSRLRWALFPVRTFRAFRAAVWAGEQSPVRAAATADARRNQRRKTAGEVAPVRPQGDPTSPKTNGHRPAASTAPAPLAWISPPGDFALAAAVPTPTAAQRLSRGKANLADVRSAFYGGEKAADLARRLSVSKRTAERWYAELREQEPAEGEAE